MFFLLRIRRILFQPFFPLARRIKRHPKAGCYVDKTVAILKHLHELPFRHEQGSCKFVRIELMQIVSSRESAIGERKIVIVGNIHSFDVVSKLMRESEPASRFGFGSLCIRTCCLIRSLDNHPRQTIRQGGLERSDADIPAYMNDRYGKSDSIPIVREHIGRMFSCIFPNQLRQRKPPLNQESQKTVKRRQKTKTTTYFKYPIFFIFGRKGVVPKSSP